MCPPGKIAGYAGVKRTIAPVGHDVDPATRHDGVDRFLRSRLQLLRIVEGETHDNGRDALLLAVQFADLDLSAERRVGNIHSAERDVLLQDRRARAAGDGADLGAADMHTISLPRRLVAV